ncbi:acyltransferase family protein [Bacteroides congonensis]
MIMQKRLFQYDALKVFSIFLVILGHVFIYTFHQFDNLIVSFINVVNMGMFMFISGFFAGKPSLLGLRKRIRSLLIPSITVGVLYSFVKRISFESFIVSDLHLGYWFCFTLFCIYVIHLLSYLIGSIMLRNSTIFVDLCFVICVLILLVCYALFYSDCELGRILSIPMLSRFIPYYCYGVILRNNKKLNRFVHNNSVFTISLIVLLIVFYINPNSTINRLLISFSYINVMVYTFSLWFTDKSNNVISYVAARTINVYLFHFFFLPSLAIFWPKSFCIDSNIVLVLLGVGFIGIVVLLETLLFTKFIETSNFLSLTFFGKQNKK